MRHRSLLVAFGLMALIPVVALGVVLGATLEGTIRERTIENASRSATFVATLVIPAYVDSEQVESGVGLRERLVLDSVGEIPTVGDNLAGLEIRNRNGRIVYSDHTASIGATTTPDATFRATLRGDAHSEVTKSRGQEVLAISVPLQYPLKLRASGVMTMYVPYSLIANAIARDMRKLYVILAAGLGLLYLLLFPIVMRASNALRRHAAESEHLAHHDVLTGLPNRLLFSRRLQRELRSRSEGSTIGVMVVDIDHFKDVNDRLGHLFGDTVLKGVAARMAECVRDGDTVARLGGDEFGVVVPNADRRTIERIAQRISDTLALPLIADGKPARGIASIGIAVAPEDGLEHDELLSAADAAMYAAKRVGGRYLFAGEADDDSEIAQTA